MSAVRNHQLCAHAKPERRYLELDGMGVAQLVRREPASYSCLAGEPTQLDAYSGT
jgi:hypothetical protein